MFPLTVVLPTKNEAHNIRNFLASLPDYVPLIIIDDSDDDTVAVVQECRPDNTVIITAAGGVARKRQLGAEACPTPWLLSTDADILFPPGYFQHLQPYLQGEGFYGPKLSTGEYQHYYRLFTAGQVFLSHLGIPAASGSNMAVRKDVLMAAGGYNVNLTCNEDTDLALRLARAGCRLTWAPDLPVYNTDHRRLRRGALWRLAHIVARGSIIYLNLYLPLPAWLVNSSWGYWR